MIRAGVDVVRLNFSHGTAEDHLKRATGEGISAKVGRTVAIMCDLQGPRSASASSATERRPREGQPSYWMPRPKSATASASASTTRSSARRRAGRAAPSRRRQDRARGHRRARRRGAHGGAPRRRALQQQGHQPPGRRAHRAGAHREGHGGHQDRDQASGRLPRGVVPEDRRRHVHGARAHARRRRQGVPDREDRARRSRGEAALIDIMRGSDGIMVARGDLAVESATPRCPRCRRR